MGKTSYFSTKTPLSTINYILPNKHAQYILRPCNDIYTHARRKRYEENIDIWLQEPFLSDYERYKDEFNEEYDEEYRYNEEGTYDEIYDNGRDNQAINSDIIENLYDEIISVVYGNGYELDDTNLFKEDLIYFIYRLSKI